LGGSSEEDTFGGAIIKTYDSLPINSNNLLFPSHGVEDLGPLHPPPVHIFRLWQVYLDNVNPILKLFHAPTVQQQVLDASADPLDINKSMQVLMFGIYAMAISSMTDEETKALFKETREILLKRYQNGAKQALLQAEFMRSSDMTVLRGYVLYLVSMLTLFDQYFFFSR
jgi:hypothetical protein